MSEGSTGTTISKLVQPIESKYYSQRPIFSGVTEKIECVFFKGYNKKRMVKTTKKVTYVLDQETPVDIVGLRRVCRFDYSSNVLVETVHLKLYGDFVDIGGEILRYRKLKTKLVLEIRE